MHPVVFTRFEIAQAVARFKANPAALAAYHAHRRRRRVLRQTAQPANAPGPFPLWSWPLMAAVALTLLHWLPR